MKKLLLFVIIVMTSCKSHYSTNYKITSLLGSIYYTNSFEIKNNKIIFKEYGKNNIGYRPISLPQPFVISISPLQDIQVKGYIEELEEIGYSKKWATHKALVEYDILPMDEEYLAIEED